MGPGAATQEWNDALGTGRRNAIERQRPDPRGGRSGFFLLDPIRSRRRSMLHFQERRPEGEARLLKHYRRVIDSFLEEHGHRRADQ
jgi:hypothetical protein